MTFEQWAEPDGRYSGRYSYSSPGVTTCEGSAEEWLAIARVLESGTGNASFKRVAAYWGTCGEHRYCFIRCPRNAVGEIDVEMLWEPEARKLAELIRRTLWECGEACVYSGQGYDPIEMGC